MIVEVVPYDPEWNGKYQLERAKLIGSLGLLISNVHHIGSTSVAGLAAKPIIDMLLEVPDLEDLDGAKGTFERLGYEVMGEYGIKGRRYYRKGHKTRTHQIHAFRTGDANIKRHIAFRDYLAQHPSVRHEYAQLKTQVAKRCHNDIDAYCDGKDAFVKHHEALALRWLAAN